MNKLREEYFRWMCSLVGERGTGRVSYKKLLGYLFDKEFTYSVRMDINRVEDGIALRYRFGQDTGKFVNEISASLDICPCSVLEMMCALSLRCEESIMADPDSDCKPSRWFWVMISSLGLEYANDANFSYASTEKIINRFLERRYKPNGSGSLFTVSGRNDMRTAEIWYQMMWYLDEVISQKGV